MCVEKIQKTQHSYPFKVTFFIFMIFLIECVGVAA